MNVLADELAERGLQADVRLKRWQQSGAGLEIHQQLDTGKLFSRTPSFLRNEEPDYEIKRKLHKVAGEIEQTLPKAHGSGIGNIMGGIANFVGYESDQNAADAKLKVLSDKLLKAVPRFSGPQSDKDVQSYKEAAGSIGDPSLPMNGRMAALQTIKDLNDPELIAEIIKQLILNGFYKVDSTYQGKVNIKTKTVREHASLGKYIGSESDGKFIILKFD